MNGRETDVEKETRVLTVLRPSWSRPRFWNTDGDWSEVTGDERRGSATGDVNKSTWTATGDLDS